MSKFHVLVSYLTVFCLLNLRSIVGSESVDKVFVVEGIVDLKCKLVCWPRCIRACILDKDT